MVAGIGYDKAIPSNSLGRGFQCFDKAITGSLFAAANTVRVIGRLKPVEGLALKALYQTSEVEKALGNAADLRILMMPKVG